MGANFNVAAFRDVAKQTGFDGPVPAYLSRRGGNLTAMAQSFSPADAERIVAQCASVRWAVENQAKVPEPYWRDSVIGVGKYTSGGDATVHQWSREHPKYDPEETERKVNGWNGSGATTCEKLAEHNPVACGACSHRGRIKSPISLGYADKPNAEVSTLPRLSLKDGLIGLSNEPPPPRDFCLRELVLACKVCLLAGFGGVSKTQWLIQFAVCTALGLLFMGKETVAGCVLLILGEEDQDEIARRFNAVVKAMKLTPEQIALVAARARAFPMIGLDMRMTQVRGGSLEGTAFAAEIIEAARQLEAETGMPCRLIGLDHAGLLHGGEFNAREDVVQTMRQVNRIAAETGAAVMVLAHSPKGAANNEKASSADVAGSTAWVDHSRAALVLRTIGEDDAKRYGIDKDSRNSYVGLHVVKNNYGPTGDTFWMLRTPVSGYGVGYLNHAELSEPVKVPKGAAADEIKVFEYIAARPGQFTVTRFRNTVGGKKDGPLGMSKDTLESTVKTLLADGRLVNREVTETERKQFGHREGKLLVLEAKI